MLAPRNDEPVVTAVSFINIKSAGTQIPVLQTSLMFAMSRPTLRGVRDRHDTRGGMRWPLAASLRRPTGAGMFARKITGGEMTTLFADGPKRVIPAHRLAP